MTDAKDAESVVADDRSNARVLGFQSLTDEVRVPQLPISGEFPRWITGMAIRATPAMLDVGGSPVGHWFDGQAMVNVFNIADGQVSYANQFLDTMSYRGARRGRRSQAVSMGTDPCRYLGSRLTALFDSTQLGTPNVAITKIGKRFTATTESPSPLEFDPRTLQTKGYLSLRNNPQEFHGVFAHPHIDTKTGELITYITQYGLLNRHRIFAVDPDSLQRTDIGEVPAAREPEYMHSFGMSENFILLAKQPLHYSLPAILRSGKFSEGYRWQPERGTTFVVVDRRTGQVHGSYHSDAMFFWHQANTFEDGDDLIFDVVASDDPRQVWDLDLVRLRNPVHRPAFHGQLRRYRIPLDHGPVRKEVLCEARMEFPQINYDLFAGRPYRYVYGIAYSHMASDWFDEIVKIDVDEGLIARWAEDGCYPSEPIIVPHKESKNEDDGVLLNIVLDSRNNRSFLIALDLSNLAELARAELPHHIPFNFHQAFFG